MDRWDHGRRLVDPNGRPRRARRAKVLVDNWIDLLERDDHPTDLTGGPAGPPVSDAQGTDPSGSAAEAPSPAGPAMSIDGVVSAFPDLASAHVVLLREGARFQHLGTVHPRGPAGPTRAAYTSLGLTDEQASALEFVLTWFGAPFDAVNVGGGPADLTWGVWNFAGRRLARCLAAWKQEAPPVFDALLARHGITVTAESSGPTRLTISLTRSGHLLRGDRVRQATATDPDLVAALALAGREPTAQLAQLATIVSRSVGPALAIPAPLRSEARSLGDLVKSSRGLAVIFYLALRSGRRRTARLVEALDGRGGALGDETAILSAVVDRLRAVGRGADAHHALRILSSPELDAR
jgi:hypothetical protein